MLERIKLWMQGGSSEAGPSAPGGMAELNVLMVCSGNICRSPTAEGVLRAKLQRAGLPGVRVDSAGTHGYHLSEAPDARAQAAALRRGYDLSKLRARPVQQADFARFQWLMAMDASHLAWLHARAQHAAPEQLRLLMEHGQRFKGVTEVPDPYYGSPEGFEHVLDLVEDACDGLVKLIRQQRAGQ